MMENVNEFVTNTVMENVIEDVAEEAVKNTAKKGLGKGTKLTIGGVIVTVIAGGLIWGFNKIKKAKYKTDDNVIDAEHTIIEEEVIEEN